MELISGGAMPRGFSILHEIADRFPPPSGPFEPMGSSEQSYAVIVIIPQPNGKQVGGGRLGELRLRRTPGPDLIRLEPHLNLNLGGKAYLVEASVDCAPDALATPRRWEVTTRVANPDGSTLPFTAGKLTGRSADGQVTLTRGADKSFPAPARWTASWCLFDVLQRHAGSTDELRFDLLDELELWKPGHRLLYRRTIEVSWAGRRLKLRGYEQFGHGLLPYEWWLDEQARVVAAIGGQRAYLWSTAGGEQ